MKEFSSCTITVIRISSCYKSRTRFSSCKPKIPPLFYCLPFIVMRRRPGDYLKPGEDEIDGLKRRLDDRLAPPSESRQFNSTHGVDNDWEIGDCLAQWWRPNFETFMVRVTPLRCWLVLTCVAVSVRPRSHYETQGMQETFPCPDARKECVFCHLTHPSLYWSALRAEVLAVPKNMKLLAIPLFELYDNAARYGPQLSAIPHLLSRYACPCKLSP